MEFLELYKVFFWDYFVNNWIEILAAVLTLICVWLNVHENPWGWVVGSLSILGYAYFYFESSSPYNFLLYIYFLATNVYGWWNWKYAKKDTKPLAISQMNQRYLLGILAACALLSAGLGFWARQYPSIQYPYLDATTSVFSVAAQAMLTQKKVENWAIWIGVNALYVVWFFVYFEPTPYFSGFLYVILFAMAVKGWIDWKKKYNLIRE
jgi:nicotinamide mononucleotide transporter